MRAPIVLAVALVVLTPVAGAQDSTLATPAPICLRARPKPACSGFVLTNAGAYVVFGSGSGGAAPRAVLDYGLMVNRSPRTAIGGSVFASVDRDGFAIGPAVRYRRWLTPRTSIEVALGKPVAGDYRFRSGAVFGLVKWSPSHWFAIAARPELVRRPTCGATCVYRTQGRVSLGMEAGGAPGVVITAGAGAGLLVFLLILGGARWD